MTTPRPVHLALANDSHLLIEFSDGQRRLYSFAQLREACPCATCRERRDQRAAVDPLMLPVLREEEAEPVRILAMQPVGNYAYSIRFSDGHDTGIYTFELLRALGTAQE